VEGRGSGIERWHFLSRDDDEERTLGKLPKYAPLEAVQIATKLNIVKSLRLRTFDFSSSVNCLTKSEVAATYDHAQPNPMKKRPVKTRHTLCSVFRSFSKILDQRCMVQDFGPLLFPGIESSHECQVALEVMRPAMYASKFVSPA
jgi:hypothetical protein